MINKIQTDNTMMDSMVYYLKILGMETILKDEDEALKYETEKSIISSDLYLAVLDGRATPDLFVYPDEIMIQSNIPDNIIEIADGNIDNIPEVYKTLLFENMKAFYAESYIEYNDYYRKLNGYPNIGDNGILIDYEIAGVDTSKPIHLMTQTELLTLNSLGIIEELKALYPTKLYLDHLLEKKISIYKARKATKFGALYIPSIDESYILNKFKTKLERNRVFTLKTIYSDAYKIGSDYYDKFMDILIKVQTMIDIIAEMPEMLIKRDLFDSATIKDMFKSYGVDYFEDIPKKYQIMMLKNLNSLIKFKSSTSNMVDICSMFGFNNVKIFRYYLLKDRLKTDSGEFVFNYTEDPTTGDLVLKDEDNYELKFIKVPIKESIDDYVRNKSNQFEYEDITSDDIYWNGDKDPELVKKEILSYEFNTTLSKYMSIDTIYDMSKLTFEICYFFNLIFSNKNLEEYLTMKVKYIDQDKQFKMTDIVCLLYVLMYESLDIVDTIIDSTANILYIKGFNMQANMATLSTYVKSQGYTLAQLGVSGYTIPTNNILTYNQMLDIFTKNKDIYNHVVKQIAKPSSLKMYKIYKTIYDALFIKRLNTTMFTLSDGSLAPTYTDYLQQRDQMIYDVIVSIRSLSGAEKSGKINEVINELLLSLEDYIDTTQFDFIFSNIPSLSSEMIKGYIYQIINFFKSYKVELNSINTIYKFDDQLENRFIIVDKLMVPYVTLTKTDKMLKKDIIKKLYIKLLSKEIMSYDDAISLYQKLTKKDSNIIIDKNIYDILLKDDDVVDLHFRDKRITLSKLTLKSISPFNDSVFITYV